MLVLVVLAILAVGWWLLTSMRQRKEEDARRFALAVGEELLLKQDGRFVVQHLSPKAQVRYPPSWHERFAGYVRDLGAPQSPVTVEGNVEFQNYFLEPAATFRASVTYATGPAHLDMRFSLAGVRWQIEYLNLIWTPPGR